MYVERKQTARLKSVSEGKIKTGASLPSDCPVHVLEKHHNSWFCSGAAFLSAWCNTSLCVQLPLRSDVLRFSVEFVHGQGKG